jgi:hypothetical protein
MGGYPPFAKRTVGARRLFSFVRVVTPGTPRVSWQFQLYTKTAGPEAVL